jgi:hypothetical protein
MSAGGWRLYPQQVGLGPAESKALAAADPKEIQALGAEYRSRLVDGEHWNARSVAFAPTGGQRIAPLEAEVLRSVLLDFTTPMGGLDKPLASDDERRAFDARLSQWLGQHLKVAPAEAAQGAIWAWLGCAVAPELVRWRFAGDTIDHRRFSGSRVRNLFGSRWWRWCLLWDASHPDRPEWLLTGLGEDELVALTERTTLASNGPLIRTFAAAFLGAAEADAGLSRMAVLRDATKRLLRLNGLLALDALDADELAATSHRILAETVSALGGRAQRVRRAEPAATAALTPRPTPAALDAHAAAATQPEPATPEPGTPEPGTPEATDHAFEAGGWWLLEACERPEPAPTTQVSARLDLPTRLDQLLDSLDDSTLPGAPFSTQQREVILMGLERGAVAVASMGATERRAVRHAFSANAAYEELLDAIKRLLQLD